MDEVAHTSLSVHFLSKPTVLRVNKNACVCHRLLTTNTLCSVRHTLNIISLIDGGVADAATVSSQSATASSSSSPPRVWCCQPLSRQTSSSGQRVGTAVKKVRRAKEHGHKLKEDSSLGCWLSDSLRAPVLFVTLPVCLSLASWLRASLCVLTLLHYAETFFFLPFPLLQILPAARELVPSMVLMFQLIALPASSGHMSSVLAWGAFPICGPRLDLVQGRWVGCKSEVAATRFPSTLSTELYVSRVIKLGSEPLSSEASPTCNWTSLKKLKPSSPLIWTTGCATCTLRCVSACGIRDVSSRVSFEDSYRSILAFVFIKVLVLVNGSEC